MCESIYVYFYRYEFSKNFKTVLTSFKILVLIRLFIIYEQDLKRMYSSYRIARLYLISSVFKLSILYYITIGPTNGLTVKA